MIRFCFQCRAPLAPDHYQIATTQAPLCQVCRLLETGDPDGIVPAEEEDDDG